MYSYWEKYHWFEKVDYAIVGAGIVGLSTALELRALFPEAVIAVYERAAIPHGASTKNAGFACFGTLSEIMDDLESLSEQAVIDLIQLRWKGLQRLLARVPKEAMSYIPTGGYEVFKDETELDQYSKSLIYVNQLIESAIGKTKVLKYSNDYAFKGLCKTSIKNDEEAQINPVNLIKYLIAQCQKASIPIKFSTEISAFNDNKNGVELVVNKTIKLQTKRLLICNNAFAKRLLPSLDITPARNQVIVSKPFSKPPIIGTFHYDKGYVYFRNIGNRVLIGGARNIDTLEETTSVFGENPKVIQHLLSFLENKLLGQPIEVDIKWSGIIATGSNKTSIIKRHSNNVFLGVRQGGMGIAIGSEVAYKLAHLFK